MAIWKRTNNDIQYTTQKTKDRATRTLLKIEDEAQVFRNVDIYINGTFTMEKFNSSLKTSH